MKRLSPDRRAVWLASVAAVMPVATPTLSLPPAAAATAREFAPPSDPMVLTRTLRRPLPGGAEVLTRRSYEIRFVPEAGGYRVDGRLVGVEVDAPPSLQALATLERRRPDEGMFPMRLDSLGKLRPKNSEYHAEDVGQAARLVRAQVDALALEPFAKSEARAFAGAFEHRSVRTAWPEDLFHPAPGSREEKRTVPLPNGARGTITTSVDVHTHGTTGLLGTFVRRVTTDLDGSNRITEETWTLAAKS